MITLAYGLKKPESGDKGPEVFPALEGNFDQLDDHDHNGTNSKQLTTTSFVQTVQTLSSVNWSLVSNGIYKQTATTPAGVSYDTKTPQFRLSTGELLYLDTVRLSATQFEVYINDNSVDVKVYY